MAGEDVDFRTSMHRGGLGLFVREVPGLSGLARLPDMDAIIVRAVGKTAEWMHREAGARMKESVRFPAGYLSPDRYDVKKGQGFRDAVITARFRPTSLARFATSAGPRNGVHLEVTPGKRIHMKSAFLINLRNGNTGLAMRSGAFDRIYSQLQARGLAGGIFAPDSGKDGIEILYGPSVDQVFRNISAQMKGEVETRLADDVLALFNAADRIREKRRARS